MEEKKVLIVGGGIGGISAALTLAKKKLKGIKIVLVNLTPHLEYHATLYRVLTGHSPLEVCIPLGEIFKGTDVEFSQDKIVEIDFVEKIAVGESQSKYKYDYIVLGLGSETAYYDIPGLRELSFSVKSITETLRLNHHLHESFSQCQLMPDTEDKKCNTHIVVVGGGATGIEVAGALALYSKKLARKHNVDETMVRVDLITSPERLLPDLSQDISAKVKKRLESLGVSVILKNRVLEEEVEKVHLKDVTMRTKTVIWCAGVKGNGLLKKWGLPVEKGGKVTVNEYLTPTGEQFKEVFVIGDSASTKFSGMAKTAWYDGKFVGNNILKIIEGKNPDIYKPVSVEYFIPVGPSWAATVVGNLKFYGWIGWFMRKCVDLIFFHWILPFPKALDAFRQDKVLWERCPICKDSKGEADA